MDVREHLVVGTDAHGGSKPTPLGATLARAEDVSNGAIPGGIAGGEAEDGGGNIIRGGGWIRRENDGGAPPYGNE